MDECKPLPLARARLLSREDFTRLNESEREAPRCDNRLAGMRFARQQKRGERKVGRPAAEQWAVGPRQMCGASPSTVRAEVCRAIYDLYS